jgi:hypothetical protein
LGGAISTSTQIYLEIPQAPSNTMVFRALIVVLTLASVASEAQARNNLRPFAARHAAHHHAKKAASPTVTPATKTSTKSGHVAHHLGKKNAVPVTTPVKASEAIPDRDEAEKLAEKVMEGPEKVMTTPAASEPPKVAAVVAEHLTAVPQLKNDAAGEPTAVTQLKNDLADVKQMRANVGVVEQALASDVSLLRETAKLERMAGTTQAHQSAQAQLHIAEQFVKATEAMVIKARGDADERARAALKEAAEVQTAVDALIAEAKVDVKKAKPAAEASSKKEAPPTNEAPEAAPTNEAKDDSDAVSM